MSDIRHIMVDIETLGTDVGSVVLSIGAVEFDPHTDRLGPPFYAVISLADSLALGLTIDAKTLGWWLEQGEEARVVLKQATSTDAKIFKWTLGTAITSFNDYCVPYGSSDEVRIWAHGPHFDISLLDEARRKAGNPPFSFPYNAPRDTRTLFEIAGLDFKAFPRTGETHNALDDAVTQAREVQKAYQMLTVQKSCDVYAEVAAQVITQEPEWIASDPFKNVGEVHETWPIDHKPRGNERNWHWAKVHVYGDHGEEIRDRIVAFLNGDQPRKIGMVPALAAPYGKAPAEAKTYHEVRAILHQAYPTVFPARGQPAKPLKIGIRQDLFAVATDLDLTRRDIKRFLEIYCRRPEYLEALATRVVRYGLGSTKGTTHSYELSGMSLAHREHAEQQLMAWSDRQKRSEVVG